MPDALAFFVPGDPVPKARPRMGHGVVYTPKRTQDWETTVGWAAREAMQVRNVDMFTQSVFVELTFWYGNNGADLDNLIKAVWDALNGIAWQDDVQVERLSACVHRGCAKKERGVKVWILTQ